MPNKATNGAGTIRKVERTVKGKAYCYWEARFCAGTDPGTGKLIRRSVTGKTQKEVREKLRAATAAIDSGEYFEPSRITLGEWLDVWSADYLNSVKPRTATNYKANIKNHIKPALGAVKLSALTAPDIQHFYNSIVNVDTGGELSAKTVKNVHGTLHKALEKAVTLGYLRFNPADRPDLPKVEKKEIKPLDSTQSAEFLDAIKGHPFEIIYTVTLFTGLREGEIMGLSWDCIDFERGTITIKQQLQGLRGTRGEYAIVTTKNSKQRTISPAKSVMQLLKHQRAEQAKMRLAAGSAWSNPHNLVFTNALGKNVSPYTVYHNFKRLAASIGIPDARFHDLRHSYAVAALRSGDDIKTVQGNLGHHTAAFTLDTYAHVTEEMKRDSADRMEQYIAFVQAKKRA